MICISSYVFVLLLQVVAMSLPDHWMKKFFLAHTYLELQMNEEALKMYLDLQENGFKKSTYVMAQVAVCLQNMQGKQQPKQTIA